MSMSTYRRLMFVDTSLIPLLPIDIGMAGEEGVGKMCGWRFMQGKNCGRLLVRYGEAVYFRVSEDKLVSLRTSDCIDLQTFDCAFRPETSNLRTLVKLDTMYSFYYQSF